MRRTYAYFPAAAAVFIQTETLTEIHLTNKETPVKNLHMNQNTMAPFHNNMVIMILYLVQLIANKVFIINMHKGEITSNYNNQLIYTNNKNW